MNPSDKSIAEHYYWSDNCDSWVFVDSDSLSVKQENMPANTKEQLHLHADAQQFFFILKEIAVFYVNGEEKAVKENQGILINAGSEHYISNQSEGQLDFLVISQPSTNNDRKNI